VSLLDLDLERDLDVDLDRRALRLERELDVDLERRLLLSTERDRDLKRIFLFSLEDSSLVISFVSSTILLRIGLALGRDSPGN
jgi:hypothetical protein